MKRFKKSIVLLGMALVSSAYASNTNQVKLYFTDDVNKLSFYYVDSEVTAGQSHGTSLYNNKIVDNSYLLLDYHMDRKFSDTVARDYANKLQNNTDYVKGLNATTVMPDKMSFFFWGGLRINNYQLSADAYIGQTHQNGTNNWWFGSLAEGNTKIWAPYGKAIIFDSDKYLSLMSTDGHQFCLSQKDTSRKAFMIGRCGDQNWVHFKMLDDVKDVSFSLLPGNEGVKVKDKVAYYPSLTKNTISNNQLDILFNLERKHADSKEVAQGFTGQVGLADLSLGGTNMPDSMRFDLVGNLSINGDPVINEVHLGQLGDNGNNWIIGSRGAQNINANLQVTTQSGEHYCIAQYNKSIDTFTIGRCSDGSGDDGTKLHDNLFEIYSGSGVSKLEFNMYGFNVTEGQPYQSQLIKNEMIDGVLNIDFAADLKGSDAVTSSYYGQVGKNSSYNKDVAEPKNLMYYFFGQLKINDDPVVSSVYFSASEHMFIGAKGATKVGGDKSFIKLYTESGRNYCVSNGVGGNTFMISNQCPEQGKSPKVNNVFFDYGNGVTSLSFDLTEGSMIASAGTPHSDIVTTKYGTNNHDLAIEIVSGQDKSKQLAIDIQNILANGDLIGPNKSNDWPTYIDFYFRGTIEINNSPIEEEFYIAQGKEYLCKGGVASISGGCNYYKYWWAGTGAAQKLDNHSQKIRTKDGHTYEIYNKGNSDWNDDIKDTNVFGIKLIS